MGNCDILLVIPLQEEFDTLKQFCQADFIDKSDVNYYYSVKFPNCPYHILCVKLHQTGPTHANNVTVSAMQYCQPHLVILIGIGGALDKDLLLGDVVVGDEIHAFQVDSKAKEAQGRFIFKYSGRHWDVPARWTGFVNNYSDTSPVLFKSWVRRVKSAREKLQLEGAQLHFIHDLPVYKLGHVASGDVVGASESYAAQLLDKDRKYKVLEMEAAGVAEACKYRFHEVDFLVIRGLSDFSDSRKTELDQVADGAFRKLAMTSAITLLLGMLQSKDFQSILVPSHTHPIGELLGAKEPFVYGIEEELMLRFQSYFAKYDSIEAVREQYLADVGKSKGINSIAWLYFSERVEQFRKINEQMSIIGCRDMTRVNFNNTKVRNEYEAILEEVMTTGKEVLDLVEIGLKLQEDHRLGYFVQKGLLDVIIRADEVNSIFKSVIANSKAPSQLVFPMLNLTNAIEQLCRSLNALNQGIWDSLSSDD